MLKKSLRAPLALIMLLVATAGTLAAQSNPSPVGDWEGVLSVPAQGVEVTIVFHIAQAEDGTYTATMDSPDQGAFGIQCETPVLDGASLEVPVTEVQGVFEGTIAEDRSMIDGTWSQGGASFDLVLKPATADDG